MEKVTKTVFCAGSRPVYINFRNRFGCGLEESILCFTPKVSHVNQPLKVQPPKKRAGADPNLPSSPWSMSSMANALADDTQSTASTQEEFLYYHPGARGVTVDSG